MSTSTSLLRFPRRHERNPKFCRRRAQEKTAAVCAMEALNEELRALQYRKQDQRQQLVAAAAETSADARRTHLVIEATLLDALHNSDEDRATTSSALLACKRELREQMHESMRLMQACPA